MYKSKLQELCHQRCWSLPEYRTVKDGPDHNPRFTSTVTINGLPFQTPPDHCISSKEAQNLAALLAYLHFSTSNPIINHLSGASSSSSHTDINPEQIALLLNQENPFGWRDDTGHKEILHTFKNRLQHFTQKQNLSLPAYLCEFEGPPHARRFRSKVIIADKTYESFEFFPTLKESEHAAAKFAFEMLSHDDTEADERLYKTLLQELAQKKGLQFPKYSSVKSGPPHVPTFISIVEIGTDVFQGLEAKTKKQAEMSAAKVAYHTLLKYAKIEGRLSSNSELNAQFQDPLPLTSLEPSPSVTVNHPKCDISNAMHQKHAGAGHKSSRKFIVYPKDVKRGTPDAGSIMPYSNDQYVALELKDNSMQ